MSPPQRRRKKGWNSRSTQFLGTSGLRGRTAGSTLLVNAGWITRESQWNIRWDGVGNRYFTQMIMSQSLANGAPRWQNGGPSRQKYASGGSTESTAGS